jgi:uncharacterized membrane protein
VKTSLPTPVTLLSLAVALYAMGAYAGLPLGAVLHPALAPSFAEHRSVVVYLHVFGAAVALQFWPVLRARRPRLHRWLGRVYLGLGVGVGGLSGLVLALQAFGGAWARAGFTALALCWMTSGALAWWCIVQRDVHGHRRWMLRNYALTFAAVTLRLYLPMAVVGGLSIDVAYPVVAWLCWLPNLWMAERLLADRRGPFGPLSRGLAHKDPTT